MLFPPCLGTGKTFMGSLIVRAILGNTSSVKVLIVCNTNHALDQILEDLHSQGVKDIARVKGMGRASLQSSHNSQ